MVDTDGKEMKGNELVLSLFGVNQGREYSLHFETREEGKNCERAILPGREKNNQLLVL